MIISMDTKKFIWPVVGVIVVGLLVFGYLYFSKPAKEGTLNTTEKVSENVPKIITNAGEEVPEVNPLDRANPFKYTNPLR